MSVLMTKQTALSLFDESKTLIKKHSSLIQTNNVTTLQQRKSINAFILIARQVLKRDPNQTTFKIELSTLKKLAWIKNTNYEAVKESLKGLLTTAIEYNVLDKDKEVEWGAFNILSEVNIKTENNNNAVISFWFPTKILEQIKSPRMYSTLDLVIIRDLNSKYSLALYELLKDYQNLWTFVFKVEDLKKTLWVDQMKGYKVFSEFRKRVLKPAVDEINEKTDLQVTYEGKKQGAEYVEVEFKVDTKRVAEELNLSELDEVDIHLQQFWFTTDEIKEYKEKYDKEYIIGNLKIAEEEFKKGKINNLSGYIRTALSKDFRVKKTEFELEQERVKEERKAKEEELKRQREEQAQQERMFREERQAAIQAEIDKRWEEFKQQMEKEFIEEFIKKNDINKRMLEKWWINNPLIHGRFLDFVEQKLENQM